MSGERPSIPPVTFVVLIVFVIMASASFPRAQEWHPAEPEPDGKDWVQLSSGEWVRGTIEIFRDLEMEFDSDDLGDLLIDWEDIAAFRTPRVMTFVFTGKRTVAGTGSMRGDTVRVSMEEGIVRFHREDLLSIVKGGGRRIDFWSIKANVGLTLRAGNAESADYVSRIRIKREGRRSRLGIEYQGDVSRVESDLTADKHTGGATLDLFVSRKFFIRPAAIEFYTDRFQNIDYRVTASSGVGYYLFRESDIEWALGIGAGYQDSRYRSVEQGEDTRETTAAAIPSTRLEADITKDIEFDLEYRAQVGVPDPKESTHRLDALLTIEFYREIFELTFSLTWDHIENPKRYENGTVPKRDELKLAFGFGIDL